MASATVTNHRLCFTTGNQSERRTETARESGARGVQRQRHLSSRRPPVCGGQSRGQSHLQERDWAQGTAAEKGKGGVPCSLRHVEGEQMPVESLYHSKQQMFAEH